MMTRARWERPAGRRCGWTAAAMLLGVTGAACATPGVPLGQKPDHTVQVVFQKGCPKEVRPEGKSCDPGRPACFHAHNGQVVLFQASQPGDGDPSHLYYELQFDPFKRAPLRSGAGKLLVKIDVAVERGKPKEFQYNVLSGTCDPLDPQIIVDD